MSTLSENIKSLRTEGLSYNEISKVLNCSKGLISYHCGEGQKEKTLSRQQAHRGDPIKRRMRHYKTKVKTYRVPEYRTTEKEMRRAKISNFHRDSNGVYDTPSFNYDDLLKHLGDSPSICYLSGREIDLSDSKTYHFDHIVPRSKGGTNSLNNLGVTVKEANIAKNNLSVEEFIALCRDVLVHNGYTVSPPE